MIVNYKALGVWSIAGTDGRLVTIVPGVNEKTDEDWKAIKDHPDVKNRIDEEVLVLVKTETTDGRKKQPEGLPKTLEGMNAGGAIDFIGGIFDIDQLKVWKKKETRSGVISTLDKQIKAVKAAADANSRE